MSIYKLGRRRFVVLGSVASGGLLLGSACSKDKPAPAPESSPTPAEPQPVVLQPRPATGAQAGDGLDGHQTLNLFVHIAEDDTVSIIAHRSEMGQGSRTGLPQVVADEMEADWNKVRIVQALGDAKYGSQNTDGSRSVRRFFEPMRKLGAAARQMLEAAAAAQWKVPVQECAAENHRVVHRPSGKALRFGELAAAAAKQPVPDDATLKLKDKSARRYIGKGLPVVDLTAMTRGGAVYGIDLEVPDMVYASIERCPVMGGGAEKFDAEAAKKVPGVLDVIAIDAPTKPWLFKPCGGVAVIATNTWAAQQGRAALKPVWKLPTSDAGKEPSGDSTAHMAELVRRVRGEGEVIREQGNAVTAIDGSAKKLEATYEIPYLVHATMEPLAAVAHAQTGGCEIWAPCQDPQGVQKSIAGQFGYKPEQVKVNVSLLGGGFGRKSKADFEAEAVLLSRKLGKPVKVTWTREDEVRHGFYHALSAQHYRAGLDDKGKVTGWIQRTAFPSIAATFDGKADRPQNNELDLGFSDIPFALDHLRCERLPATSPVRIGWMRSVCNIQHAFGIGSFVDELARESGQDPRALWLSLLGPDRKAVQPGLKHKFSNYGEPFELHAWDTARLRGVIEKVTEMAGWGNKLPAGEGLGLSAHRSFVSYVAVVSHVKLEGKQLKLQRMYCAADCGTVVNPDRVHAQLEGGVIFGLSLALGGRIQLKDRAVVESNFDGYPLARMGQCPDVEVHIVPSDAAPGGVGEPGVPPVAPSLTNAIAAAGGPRVRSLPVSQQLQV